MSRRAARQRASTQVLVGNTVGPVTARDAAEPLFPERLQSRDRARPLPVPAYRWRGERAVVWLFWNRARLWAFWAYVAVAMALTWPVWGHPATQYIGGPSDPMSFMEWLGWYPYAISHGINPFLNTYVNLPAGSNMMWNTSVPLVAVVLWPITSLFGVLATWNVAIAAALVLDGYCTFLWVRRHVRRAWAAWLSGLTVVVSPFTFTRAHAHLELVIFFPVILIISELEKLFSGESPSARRSGLAIGLLGAVQVLCSEEVVALALIALGSALVIAALLYRTEVRARTRLLLGATATAVPTALVLAGGPLAYQFLGPGRVRGPIQAPNTFVTDVANLLVPGTYTALTPAFASHLAARWSGGIMENDAYIGVPLLVVAIFVSVKWRHDRWVKVVSLATLAALVWGLGSYLHFDGKVEHVVPLPGRLLAALPVFDNVLPARFDLFVDLGLAGLVAVFVDRVICNRSARTASRTAGVLGLLLIGATWVPTAPLPSYNPRTPKYFLAGGGAGSLRQGTVAMVVPYGDGEDTIAPMLWQALADFRFRMVAGTMYTAGRNGVPSLGRSLWGTGTTMDCVMQLIQMGEGVTPCTSDPVGAVRSELDQLKVRVIIMGPMDYGQNPSLAPPIRKFLSEVAGVGPRSRQGVLVWPYHA